MTHLTPDELVDAVEGTLAPSRQTHLNGCTVCRDEAARLGAMLQEVRALEVPDPSPLFWNHFSSRVTAAISSEATPRRAWMPEWLRWPVLAPLAAMALLVFALSATVARAPATLPVVGNAVITTSDDLSTMGEDEWAVVTEIVGLVEIDQAEAAGIAVRPGDADRIALQLDVDEQRELIRLIKEETDKSSD
jgi:hypothetical protein